MHDGFDPGQGEGEASGPARARNGTTTSRRSSTNGDYEAVFRLERPQPALLLLLASGDSPIYPCHVSPQQMRLHPIGTGPFKFVEFKQNEGIKVVKNPDYWKKGRPYLDAIEYKIVPNRSTAILGFVAGQYDMTWPYTITPRCCATSRASGRTRCAK